MSNIKVKNILQSLHDDVETGNTTLRQAGIELYQAGWFNFLPDEETIKALLKL